MQMYQFRCEDCGVLFEEVVDQEDSPVSCGLCESHRVKKLFLVTADMGDDDDMTPGAC